MVAMAGIEMPLKAVRSQIAAAVNLIVSPIILPFSFWHKYPAGSGGAQPPVAYPAARAASMIAVSCGTPLPHVAIPRIRRPRDPQIRVGL